jgi:mRNA interferase RelE/StbE
VANYKLLIKPSAAKELEALPLKIRRQIANRIQCLASEPHPFGCEKLSGREKFRIRQGDYRILYAIHNDETSVVIVKIGHRREVYR